MQILAKSKACELWLVVLLSKAFPNVPVIDETNDVTLFVIDGRLIKATMIIRTKKTFPHLISMTIPPACD